MAEIDFLLLSDHAEVQGGKLFLMGGGWTDRWLGSRPEGAQRPITHFAIALGVRVGWLECNRPHHVVITVEREDGGPLSRVEADVVVGRPPGVPEGSDQQALLALNADIQFEQGGYRIAAELSGGDARAVSFRVHDADAPRKG